MNLKTQEKGLISIIVPIYNVDQYLGRCLDSLIHQTYNKIEILCINDGSTDKSRDVLEAYAKTDGRIIVVNKENGGVSSARNVGLEIAKGEFIGFVDPDDYIDREMYQYLIELIMTNKCDISACGFNYDDCGEIKPIHNNMEIPSICLNARDFLYYIYKRDEYRGVSGYLWTRLFKRELFYKNNVLFKFEGGSSEDIKFIAEISLRAKYVVYGPRNLYYYYQRKNSLTDEFGMLNSLDAPKAYQYVIDIFSQNKINIDIINLVKRIYVYRCGKMLESALKFPSKYKQNGEYLYKCILDELDIYILMNEDKPERIDWIEHILEKWERIGNDFR